MHTRINPAILLFLFVIFSSASKAQLNSTGLWTFMKGDSAVTGYPAYGIKGLATTNNKPGARMGNNCWKDNVGNLWLYGGSGLAETTGSTLFINYPSLADMWKYDIVNGKWIWMSGTKSVNVNAVYGQRTIAHPTNTPGSRVNSIATWTDQEGKFWTIGGYGYAATGTLGTLSDVWKYDPDTDSWTWMNGNTNIDNYVSIYGIRGVAAANNKPGARLSTSGTKDAGGNIWIYGGYGRASGGATGLLDELWKFNAATNQWTWMGGSPSTGIGASYGVKGVESIDNQPGARRFSSVWCDEAGNIWLYGGEMNAGNMCDLWRYNISSGMWTWMAGDHIVNRTRIPGTIGVPDSLNIPGARLNPVSVSDSGHLYLFGGLAMGSGYYSDTWKLDINTLQWSWIKGGLSLSAANRYNTKGITDTSTILACRTLGFSWNDSGGNLWYFGGSGRYFDGSQKRFPYDDLCKFNLASKNWTWISGNNCIENMGISSMKGIPAAINKPGGREGGASWTDDNNNLWLFGGNGYQAAVINGIENENLKGELNDLWRYNPATNEWAWISGAPTIGDKGVYGTKGVFDINNTPGARWKSGVVKIKDGKVIVFGGFCNIRGGWMNDCWLYDPAISQWAWISGDTTSAAARTGVYGTIGTGAPGNKPGARERTTLWADSSGNLWMFGGYGFDANASYDYLNDLWKYDFNTGNWTWIKGDNTINKVNNTVPFGTTGTSHIDNKPGSRFGSAGWTDKDGNLWLFGGSGYAWGPNGWLHDTWKYNPVTNIWTWVNGSFGTSPPGIYGAQGIPSATARPGGRSSFNSWNDFEGNFWIFGGIGVAETNTGRLSDLWKYNPLTNQWTWIKGDKTEDRPGIYGQPTVALPANKPGNRWLSSSWKDKVGNFWMFAGWSNGGMYTNSIDPLADLWKFGNYEPPTEICSGSNSTLSASIGGSNAQWQVSTNHINFTNISDNANYSGALTGTLQVIAPPATWNGYQYRLKSNTDSSNIFTIFVNAVNQSPSVSIIASATTFIQGEEITFTASAANTIANPVYQWQVNGVNSGSNSDTLKVNNLSGVDSVRVIVTGGLPCANTNADTSNIIVMTQTGRLAVELNNKGGSIYTLDHPEMFLSAKAIERRQRFNIPVDSTDLPVNPAYLDSIRLAGNVTITGISKWLNYVCIETTDILAINKINNFSFVKNIAGIARRTTQVTEQNKFETLEAIEDTNIPAPELANIYNYGQSYNQVHIHQGEFLHNHGFSGQGMQLAMLDAGFPNYPTLPTFDSVRINNQFLGTWDFVTNNANVNGFSSHGTQCLSTIAANNPGTFVGTAPKTSFYLFRTEDAPTEQPIEELNLAAALERADSLGVDIASISLGYTTFDDPHPDHTYADMNGDITVAARAGDLAAKKGMLVVAANGNDGTNTWHYLNTPADADSVLAVGAVNTAGVVGSFSSYGPSSDGQVKPGVAAVGVNAVVAHPVTAVPFQSSGTSFACPNMAGLSTCLWQAFPESDNMGIISALQESASQFATPDNRIGYGIPDMKKAFVILLKRFYSQDIKQAGCNTLIQWTAKSSGNMNFVVERKLPTDADFVALQTMNGTGAFVNDTFNFSDNLAAFSTPINISYRIKMNIDTDTSFYFTPVIINHQNVCNTYTFTGNGNWNTAANWAGNIIPPANLPAGSSIVIDPVISGECILNITQQVQAGGYIEVRTGKKLTVPGNLIIQ